MDLFFYYKSPGARLEQLFPTSCWYWLVSQYQLTTTDNGAVNFWSIFGAVLTHSGCWQLANIVSHQPAPTTRRVFGTFWRNCIVPGCWVEAQKSQQNPVGKIPQNWLKIWPTTDSREVSKYAKNATARLSVVGVKFGVLSAKLHDKFLLVMSKIRGISHQPVTTVRCKSEYDGCCWF